MGIFRSKPLQDTKSLNQVSLSAPEPPQLLPGKSGHVVCAAVRNQTIDRWTSTRGADQADRVAYHMHVCVLVMPDIYDNYFCKNVVGGQCTTMQGASSPASAASQANLRSIRTRTVRGAIPLAAASHLLTLTAGVHNTWCRHAHVMSGGPPYRYRLNVGAVHVRRCLRFKHPLGLGRELTASLSHMYCVAMQTHGTHQRHAVCLQGLRAGKSRVEY